MDAGATGGLAFRQATPGDLRSMAVVHRHAYSRDHFLALLPEAVLADYYGRFLGGGSQAVIAERQGGAQECAPEFAGFAVFGRNIEQRIAAFRQDHRWAILGAAVRHPFLAGKKLLASEAVRREQTARHAPAPALLLSIAVAEGGRGAGGALLAEMIRRSAAAGEDRLGLYVRYHNVRAINAYIRVGFGILECIGDQYYMERNLRAGWSG